MTLWAMSWWVEATELGRDKRELTAPPSLPASLPPPTSTALQ